MLSVLDIFRIGVGPSSSHTVGPMRIAKRFIDELDHQKLLEKTIKIQVILRGSLAFTGKGHGTPNAVLTGLLGHEPESLSPQQVELDITSAYENNNISLGGRHKIAFSVSENLVFDYETEPSLHPNEMQLIAFQENDTTLLSTTYYSTGGGFIASQKQLQSPPQNDLVNTGKPVPHPFSSAAELLDICDANQCSITEVILTNEDAFRSRNETLEALENIAHVMHSCIDRGLSTQGTLPGELKVERRASKLWEIIRNTQETDVPEQLFDWLNVYAMAVNEENANGGQVVTAPTNGAAGIIPSVLRHYCTDIDDSLDATRKFLLTAGAIALLYKQRASISGAEMGCQGEIGVACSMAAGGLAAVWNASPLQVANAAEIGMEHNLGLTCDPVGGLVQIPCIERNATGAVRAVNAARLALHSDRPSKVSLDQVIETMRQTGLDMSTKYKETSLGGLAVNVVEC